MPALTVSFTMDSATDKDLVLWLERLPKGKRSETIRNTLRDGLGRGGITHSDIYEAVKDLEEKIGTSAVVVGTEQPDARPQNDIPPDIVNTLNGLGLD